MWHERDERAGADDVDVIVNLPHVTFTTLPRGTPRPTPITFARAAVTTIDPIPTHIPHAIALKTAPAVIAMATDPIVPHHIALGAVLVISVIKGIATSIGLDPANPTTIAATSAVISITPLIKPPPITVTTLTAIGLIVTAIIRITAMGISLPCFRPARRLEGWPHPSWPVLPLVAVVRGTVVWPACVRGGGVDGGGITDELATSATTPFAIPSVLPITDDEMHVPVFPPP